MHFLPEGIFIEISQVRYITELFRFKELNGDCLNDGNDLIMSGMFKMFHVE